MENYYFHDGLKKFGPYTLEELKRQPLTGSTPVWKEGMQDWTKAGNLEELRSTIVSTPPPFKKLPLTEQVGVKLGRNLGWGGLCLLLLVIGLLIYNKNQSQRTFTPLSTYIDPERGNPASYLTAAGTYKPNFWGTKWQVNGTISNLAAHTNYKDVIVKINFYSRTNTVIGTKEYVLYDYFPYGLKKQFNLELDKPAAAATCGWRAIGATVQ